MTFTKFSKTTSFLAEIYFKKKDFSESTKILEVDYVNGFALLLYRSKIKKIGMFDEQIFLYNEEIDLCKRLRLAKQKIFIDTLINNAGYTNHSNKKNFNNDFFKLLVLLVRLLRKLCIYK